MRVFVTGATGYIGKELCRRLRGDGHEVRALVRPSSRTELLTELGVSLFPGDLAERSSMREGMSGADWVVHAAAELDLDRPAAAMQTANVAGSENVASLAFKLGVPRFLSVSSMAVWGGSPADGTPANEETPHFPAAPTRYSRTKRLGEQAIQEWAKRGLCVNTVFPSLVYGPPGKKDGANSLLRMLWLGRAPVLLGADRKSSWVFLADVVDAMARVMERSPPGRGYLLAGSIATIREVARTLAHLGGAPAPRFSLPIPLAKGLLLATRPVYRLRGRRTPLPAEQLDSLRRHWAFDDRRARGELDWSPRSLASGLPPTLEMFR